MNMHRSTTATEITRTGYSIIKTSSARSIDLCILKDACNELFCMFGDFYASGLQDSRVRKSLQCGISALILQTSFCRETSEGLMKLLTVLRLNILFSGKSKNCRSKHSVGTQNIPHLCNNLTKKET